MWEGGGTERRENFFKNLIPSRELVLQKITLNKKENEEKTYNFNQINKVLFYFFFKYIINIIIIYYFLPQVVHDYLNYDVELSLVALLFFPVVVLLLPCFFLFCH